MCLSGSYSLVGFRYPPMMARVLYRAGGSLVHRAREQRAGGVRSPGERWGFDAKRDALRKDGLDRRRDKNETSRFVAAAATARAEGRGVRA